MANDIDSKNDSNAQNDNPYYKNVLLIGSPNVGKSLTFNKLTGMTAMVSNYPGTTVDIDEGNFTYEEKTVHLTDPPGLYDLNTITEEERVAKLLVLDERFDLMVHVVDAKNIEKSIDLTLQLIDAGKEVILVLNMMDELEAMGASVDAKGLSSELGIPVVLTAAAENRGLDELKHTIVNYDSIENEILKEEIFAELSKLGEKVTVSEFQAVTRFAPPEFSNQKISALLNQMEKAGRVKKEVNKKKSYFSVVTE
jgi:ferrous iron transport protein B